MSFTRLEPGQAEALMKQMGLMFPKNSDIDDFITYHTLANGDIESAARFYQNSKVKLAEEERKLLCAKFHSSKDRSKRSWKNAQAQLKEKENRLTDMGKQLKEKENQIKDLPIEGKRLSIQRKYGYDSNADKQYFG